jgi:hypothetical protein
MTSSAAGIPAGPKWRKDGSPGIARLACSIERKQPERIGQTFHETMMIERSQRMWAPEVVTGGAIGGVYEAMIELYSKLQFVCIIGTVWFPFRIAFPITLNIVL